MKPTLLKVDSMGSDATVYAAGSGSSVEDAKAELQLNPSFITNQFELWARGSNKASQYTATLRQPFETVVATFEINAGWGHFAHLQKIASGLKDHTPLTLPTYAHQIPEGFYTKNDPTQYVADTDTMVEAIERKFSDDHDDVLELIGYGVNHPTATSVASPFAGRPVLASISLMDAYEAYASSVAFGGISDEARKTIVQIWASLATVAPNAARALMGGRRGL